MRSCRYFVKSVQLKIEPKHTYALGGVYIERHLEQICDRENHLNSKHLKIVHNVVFVANIWFRRRLFSCYANGYAYATPNPSIYNRIQTFMKIYEHCRIFGQSDLFIKTKANKMSVQFNCFVLLFVISDSLKHNAQ